LEAGRGVPAALARAAAPAGPGGVPGRRVLPAQPAARARGEAVERDGGWLADGAAHHRDAGGRRVGLHPDQRHLHHRRTDLPRDRPFLLQRAARDQPGHLGLARGGERADQGHEAGRGAVAPRSGAVPRARGVRAVRLRAGSGDPEAAGSRGAHGRGAEAAPVPADAGRAADHDRLRRDQRLPRRRDRGRHQGLGAGLPRFHDSAAPDGRRGDPHPQGADRRAQRAAARGRAGVYGAREPLMAKPRELRRRIQELEGQGASIDLHLVGKKGISYFKFTKRAVASQRTDIGDKPTAAHAAELVAPLMAQFQAGTLDAVEVVFAQFKSAVSTPPTTLRILPVTPPRADRRLGGSAVSTGADALSAQPPNGLSAYYILKPSADAILESLLPLYVRNQMFRALVETAAAEHGARRTAMKNATDSAGDMLDLLRRTYNRARQAVITQELAEIVGGAEALKG